VLSFVAKGSLAFWLRVLPLFGLPLLGTACTALDKKSPTEGLDLDGGLDGSDNADGSVPGDGDGDGDGDVGGDGDGDGDSQCEPAVFDESRFDQACFE